MIELAAHETDISLETRFEALDELLRLKTMGLLRGQAERVTVD